MNTLGPPITSFIRLNRLLGVASIALEGSASRRNSYGNVCLDQLHSDATRCYTCRGIVRNHQNSVSSGKQWSMAITTRDSIAMKCSRRNNFGFWETQHLPAEWADLFQLKAGEVSRWLQTRTAFSAWLKGTALLKDADVGGVVSSPAARPRQLTRRIVRLFTFLHPYTQKGRAEATHLSALSGRKSPQGADQAQSAPGQAASTILQSYSPSEKSSWCLLGTKYVLALGLDTR